MKNRILIYGANGYTGKLFAKSLIEDDINPILAARSEKVLPIGKALNCTTRIFTTHNVGEALKDVAVLVNLAGPFKKTQNGLIEACIKSKTHYLDIAGEVPEMINAFAYNDAAVAAGITVIPAAGFGVAPTDIAAKLAANKMEHPKQLKIAYATVGGASRGTLKTVLKDIHKPGVIVKNGQHETALPTQSEYPFTVANKSFSAVYNPWRADLFTAQISTGIRHIETYSTFPGFVVKMMKGKRLWLRNLLLNRIINWMPEGPSARQLKKGKTYISATVINDAGEEKTVALVGPEAYVFTTATLKKITEKLNLETEILRGVITPAQLGLDWISTIDGVEVLN